MHSYLIPAFLCFALYLPVALSFSVTVGPAPTQCGSLNVSWTGGQAPFNITLTPAFDVPMIINVPSTAFSNNQGSYQISSFPFYNQTRFLVTMSDATGFGTGGTSDLLTVGLPAGGTCNMYNPTLAYTFGLPSSLQQCSSYTFNGYQGATLPVTVTGLIPGGESFVLQSPSSGSSFTWNADVASGTTIIFSMTDAQGRSGGSSDTQGVASSNDASCLNATSPSSTIRSSSPTSTAGSSTSASSSSHTSNGVSTGTIVGIAIGSVAAVTFVIAVAVCYLRRQRYGRLHYGLAPTRKSQRPNSMEIDPGTDNFQHPPIYPFPYQSDSVIRLAPPVTPGSQSVLGSAASYNATPLTDTSVRSSEPAYSRRPHSPSTSNSDSFAALGDLGSSAMSSSGRRKAAMAGMTSHHAPTRFIVHTDAEDEAPEVEAEVVELPPQYSERRNLTPGERPMSSATGMSSSSLAYASEHPVDESRRSTSYPPLQ